MFIDNEDIILISLLQQVIGEFVEWFFDNPFDLLVCTVEPSECFCIIQWFAKFDLFWVTQFQLI